MKKEVTLGQLLTVAATVIISLATGWITLNNKVTAHGIEIQTLQVQSEKRDLKLDRIDAKLERILIALEQKKNR